MGNDEIRRGSRRPGCGGNARTQDGFMTRAPAQLMRAAREENAMGLGM